MAAKRRGRRAANVAYYGTIAVVCLVAIVEITVQAFRRSGEPSPYPTCRVALAALSSAIDRARAAAPGTDGEEPALARFRAALEPEWKQRDGIAAQCQASEADTAALDAIERLRYAEEHAVRREAGELAPLRRQVQAIDRDLGRKGPPGGTPH
jgi:hypothetical protein